MAERRRTSRVSPQTQTYNPSAIAAAQRKREMELGAKTRTTDHKAAKRARLEAFRRTVAEIRSLIKVGDELYDDKKGEVWKVTSLGEDGEVMDKVKLSQVRRWHGGKWSVKAFCVSTLELAKFDAMLFGRPILQNHALAFAMVSHVRLGMGSVFAGLVPELIQRILESAACKGTLSKVNTVPALIPINLVLGGDSVMEIQLDKLTAPMKTAIISTLGGWKFKSTFEKGFGSITPSKISWEEISDLAVPQITDGFQPGEVAGFPLLQISERCELVQNPARIMKAYERACRRGDQEFEIAYANIWTCHHQNPCIGGDNRVLLPGGAHKLVRDLCVGDSVAIADATESALVTATWRCNVGRSIPMVSVRGVLLTPDHPVRSSGAWLLPSALAPPRLLNVDAVFNFALSSGHSLMLLPASSGAGAGDAVAAAGRATQVEASMECERKGYVQCCTLGKDVPGMPDPLWGSDRVFEAIRTVPGYPRMVTAY